MLITVGLMMFGPALFSLPNLFLSLFYSFPKDEPPNNFHLCKRVDATLFFPEKIVLGIIT